MRPAIVALAAVVAWSSHHVDQTPAADRGSQLENVAWPEAEQLLSAASVVVIPLGSGSLEHGPHLKLRADLTIATYLARRVARDSNIVVAPALTYHHYPGFVEYPGSVSVSSATAQTLTTDVVRSLARYGPRRFYVLNTSPSADRPLGLAARALASSGVLLRYTQIDAALASASRGVRRQAAGSHADEIETSMMLAIDPESVDMSRAVRDLGAVTSPLQLTRQQNGQGTYSPTGTWGDATLATKEKGRIVLDALVTTILSDIDDLRVTSLPAVTSPNPASATSPSPSAVTTVPSNPPPTCSAGDERTIRQIGDAFTTYWTNQDAAGIGGLWSVMGDLLHPDGFIERGADVIRINRARLFAEYAYRNSRHWITINRIRCLSVDVAVADAKWGLRGVTDARNQPVPQLDGLCTLVVKRGNGGWLIEAYRYTIDPTKGPVPPTLLKRPGYPGGAM